MNFQFGTAMAAGPVHGDHCNRNYRSKPRTGAPHQYRSSHGHQHGARLPWRKKPLRVGEIEKPLPVGLVPPGLLRAQTDQYYTACGDQDADPPSPRQKRTDKSAATVSTACPPDEEVPIQDLDAVSEEGGDPSAKAVAASKPQQTADDLGSDARTSPDATLREKGAPVDCTWRQEEDAGNKHVPGGCASGSLVDGELVDRLWEMKQTHKEVLAGRSPQGTAALDWLRTVEENVLHLSMTSTRGSLIVQAVIDFVDIARQKAIANQFKGHVLKAMRSPHANFVLQKCITNMPVSNIEFIMDELPGNVVEIVRHRYAYRVISRLFEHCSSQQTDSLAKELLADTEVLLKLCKGFGNYVVQCALDHLSPDSVQKQRLLDLIRLNICDLSDHTCSSRVVQCAMKHSDDEEFKRMSNDFLGGRSEKKNKPLKDTNQGSHIERFIKMQRRTRRIPGRAPG
eukprot:TRINITY_DN107893_c0_g1_i1.p1 TRINITY_DN107893_c0_g1~~TRINITY_DN107893_c0_g1_i1.p1  ORF type:complete len:454 (-),score=62.74 TRINITY_DN107893_c0_g1_i1:150-1511(-)